MDLNTIESVITPASFAELPDRRSGDAWLAGGTWLFSEPQPHLRRLVDLTALGWEPYAVSEAGLSIAATCPIALIERLELPLDWIAAPLLFRCCRALLGSFKIRRIATVGGNICMALPAGPMTALATALDGICVVWDAAGGERRVGARDFVLGPQETVLRPGELLRSVELPVAALRRRAAFRRVSLSPGGRSGALLVGTLDPTGAFALTITASVRRPVVLRYATMPDAATLQAGLTDAVTLELWYDDVHGAPDWRAHVTALLAGEIRAELAPGTPR